jgi:Zn finger protein HypA/HybF involved in hydrogenase expression
MVDRGEQLRADAEEPEHLRLAKADTVWLQSAWETEIKRNEELQRRVTTAEAVRDDARAASQRYLDEKRKVQAELNTAKLAEAAQDQARENAAQAIQEMLVKLASERDSLRAAVRTEWLTNDQRAFLRNVLGRLVPPDSNGFDWSCFGTRVAEHAGSILAALPPSEPPASALYVRCVTHDVEPGHYCNFDDVCNERILAFKATAQIKDHTHERVCNHCGHSHPFSSDEDDIDTCPGCGNEANPVARGIRHATTGGQVSTCTCSEKYRELAPGVHAKYCPLAGQPLDGI